MMISRKRHGNQKPYEVFVHCRGYEYIVLDDFASIEMIETRLIKTHEVQIADGFYCCSFSSEHPSNERIRQIP